MSGTPKKQHEEGGHSSSSKYSNEESGSVLLNPIGKSIASVANEYRPPIETGPPDARMIKIPRMESRDGGKRSSPLSSTYRIPSSTSNDLHLDHTGAPEDKLEYKDSTDNQESNKPIENKEFYNESKRDPINVKNDVGSHNDTKGDIKYEWGPHTYGKEPREHQRGYTDNWRTSYPAPVEGGKDGLPIEERDNTETQNKAVGENKVDVKGEDKSKEKDKKRKDAKHREEGEREHEKLDRCSTLQLCNSSIDVKDSVMQVAEAERIQAKTAVSAVIYKVGECMRELVKLWKEYESSETYKNNESSQSGPTLEILIPAEFVTATNRQVRGGQLWGTDIYTDDSDLVAVLMHTGYCRLTPNPPPNAIQELSATIRVLPPQDCYVSTLRNNVRSRAWGAAIGCSYRVERCCIVKKGGGKINLEPCLTNSSTLEPTLAPVAVERTMTTRAAASNALRQQRFVREVTIQYNLCNEPWIKYSISIVADKGLKKALYTSARLKKGEVLYLETHSQRYELSFMGEKMKKATSSSSSSHLNEAAEVDKIQNNNHHMHSAANGERSLAETDNVVMDAFRWSRCKKLLPQKVMRSVGIPLPLEHMEVLEENLDWEDIEWSQNGVYIAKKEYPLARVHFLSPN